MPWEASWAHCLSIGADPGMPRASDDRRAVLFDHVLRRDGEVLEARHRRGDHLEGLAVPGATLELGARRRAHVVAREHRVHDADALHLRTAFGSVSSSPRRLQSSGISVGSGCVTVLEAILSAVLELRPKEGGPVAWDFSTDEAFEEQLVWMRGFVREEIMPLETLTLTPRPAARRHRRRCRRRCSERGLWAAHLPPELGGMGFGQVKLGLMHEILGQTHLRPGRLWQQRARQRQRRVARGGHGDDRPHRHPRTRWLEPLLRRRRSARASR